MKTMQVRVPAEPVRCGSVVGGHRHRRGKARKAVAARDRIAAAACASRKPCRLNPRITRRRAVDGGMAAWPWPCSAPLAVWRPQQVDVDHQ